MEGIILHLLAHCHIPMTKISEFKEGWWRAKLFYGAKQDPFCKNPWKLASLIRLSLRELSTYEAFYVHKCVSFIESAILRNFACDIRCANTQKITSVAGPSGTLFFRGACNKNCCIENNYLNFRHKNITSE